MSNLLSTVFDSAGHPDAEQVRMVEVVRSFSFKMNLGNYQSADFFCSQKAQCLPEQIDEVSFDLHEWCFDQVMASVKDVKEKQARKAAAPASPVPAPEVRPVVQPVPEARETVEQHDERLRRQVDEQANAPEPEVQFDEKKKAEQRAAQEQSGSAAQPARPVFGRGKK